MQIVKQSKYETLKQKSKEILLASTFHGVQGIVKESNYLIRIIWIICFLISLASCSYFVLQSVLNFLDYEVMTSIQTIYEQESEFPVVSICFSKPSDPRYNYNCKFNSHNCIKNIEFFQDLVYKRCIRFNSGTDKYNMSYDVLNSTIGGIHYALNFELELKSSVGDFTEAVIFIHNKSVKAKYLYDSGFRVTSGSIYTIAIERTFDEKLEYPYNNCYKDINDFKLNKTIIDFFKQTNNSYTALECLRYCRNLIILEQSGCDCIESIDSSYKCSNPNNQSIKDCYTDFVKKFLQLNVFDICSKYCPYECDTINFSYTIITEPLPSTGKINDYDLESKFTTYEELQKKFVKIIAYYPELRYTFIRQTPKTVLSDLVSNIGGTLGLFLGTSFLSFIEIFELLIILTSIVIK